MTDYPMTTGPIGSWPGQMTRTRQQSKFKAALGATMSLLHTEMQHLEAKNVEMLLAMQPEDFRLDGQPRANAKAVHPGIILSMDSRYGHLSYPCDTFTTWQDNLRAVALALEALRKVDRYGVTKRGEQYRGFLALEAGTGLTTRAAARAFLEMIVGADSGATTMPRAELLRRARRFAHPDAGGEMSLWLKVQEAGKMLEEESA